MNKNGRGKRGGRHGVKGRHRRIIGCIEPQWRRPKGTFNPASERAETQVSTTTKGLGTELRYRTVRKRGGSAVGMRFRNISRAAGTLPRAVEVEVDWVEAGKNELERVTCHAVNAAYPLLRGGSKHIIHNCRY